MANNSSPDWDPRAVALDVLRSHRAAVVATALGGQPWASTVYYAEQGFTLYVNTPSRTTMLRNMLENPRVSYAIDDRQPSSFLQAIGRASIVSDPSEFSHARALLAVKVPEAHVGAPSYTLVKIDTDVIYVSDFRQGYRPRAEVRVSESWLADELKEQGDSS
jgi:nitroimidazol reductase NimA-like FMN-containing flavoprotein (pyridoxamine 5'-phosphate oxidase superfamily)